MDKKRTHRTIGILTALLTLSLVAETSAYAQQQTESNPSVAVKQLASLGSTALPLSEVVAASENFTSGPREAKEVEAFLDAFFAKHAIKQKAGSITVSVVQDGKVLSSKGYGSTDQTSKSPVDAGKTTYRIGSVSKVFTATAIMQLVDKGKISLQDNIEKYLNGYKVTNPFGTPVTIENLLTHTTGFEVREITDANFLADASQKPISLKDNIFNQFPPVVRKPGTSYMYDNFASELQGYIVQQVSGEPFGSYMQKHLFQPLGMTSSSFSLTNDLVERLATSYDVAGNVIPGYSFSPSELPEGSMISTASDMALFMKTLLNDGRTANGTVILTPESVKAMSTYHMAIHPDWPDTTYGFEAPVVPSKTNGEHVISKGGDLLGFSSLMWLLPDRKTGVFVSYSMNEELRVDLFTAFMDHYYAAGKTTFGPKEFEPQSEDDLAKFEGLYSDLRYKFLAKVEAAGKGVLIVSNLNGRHELKQVNDLLFLDEEGKPLAFKTDSDGRIIYLKYTNFVTYAAKMTENSAGFTDISADHPYVSYILGLQSLGYLTDDPSKPFQPLQAVTRGAFIHAVTALLSIQGSVNPSSFTDIEDSPYRKDIQVAAEIGLLNGTGGGLFEPERPIRREEAAVILIRLVAGLGLKVPDSTVALAPGTSKWAVDAVKSVIDLKLHGPEVTESNGSFDFGSQRELNKQELAAMLFTMLLADNLKY